MYLSRFFKQVWVLIAFFSFFVYSGDFEVLTPADSQTFKLHDTICISAMIDIDSLIAHGSSDYFRISLNLDSGWTIIALGNIHNLLSRNPTWGVREDYMVENLVFKDTIANKSIFMAFLIIPDYFVVSGSVHRSSVNSSCYISFKEAGNDSFESRSPGFFSIAGNQTPAKQYDKRGISSIRNQSVHLSGMYDLSGRKVQGFRLNTHLNSVLLITNGGDKKKRIPEGFFR